MKRNTLWLVVLGIGALMLLNRRNNGNGQSIMPNVRGPEMQPGVMHYAASTCSQTTKEA